MRIAQFYTLTHTRSKVAPLFPCLPLLCPPSFHRLSCIIFIDRIYQLPLLRKRVRNYSREIDAGVASISNLTIEFCANTLSQAENLKIIITISDN